MSVSSVLDITNKAYAAKSGRFYDLYVDGQIFDPQGGSGTFLIGTIGLTGAYANDSYTVSLANSAYSKFGYMVNLQLKAFSHTVVSSGGTFTISTLPANLRPATTQRYFVIGINNGTTAVCTLEIATTGVCTLYNGANPTTFSAGVGGLPQTTSVTYNIN